MEYKVFCFLFVSLFFNLAWSQTSTLGAMDQEIQRTLRELCGYDDKIIFVGHFYNQGAAHMRNEIELAVTSFDARLVKNRAEAIPVHSQYVHDFINSDIFIPEMKSCFPNEDERSAVVFLMLFADVAGQFTGVAQMGTLVWSFGAVGRSLYAGYAHVLQKLGAPVLTKEKFMTIYTWALTVIPTAFILRDKLTPKTEALNLESIKISLDLLQDKIQKLMVRNQTSEFKSTRYCAINDLAYNMAQEYFGILREAKAKGVDLQVFGNNRDFRMKIKQIKLCQDL